MNRLVLVVLSIAIPPALGFAGMVMILLANPDANIEREGWLLGWTGMGLGFATGLVAVWWLWRRHKARGQRS